MAKFLPFINESSSISFLFKGIIQRSKGSSYKTIANLLSVIISLGIETTRTILDGYSKDLTTSEQLDRLMKEYPQHHIEKEALDYWGCVLEHYLKNKKQKHPIFEPVNLKIFFTVLVCKAPDKLVEEGFTFDIKPFLKFANSDFDLTTNELERVYFDNTGKKLGFSCWQEFKAFIAFYENSDEHIIVMPVKIDAEPLIITPADYKTNKCESPYG